jgi:hypothetical protein
VLSLQIRKVVPFPERLGCTGLYSGGGTIAFRGRLSRLKAALEFFTHSIAQNTSHEKALLSLRDTEKNACHGSVRMVFKISRFPL